MKYNDLYLISAARHAYKNEDDPFIQNWFETLFNNHREEYFNIMKNNF